MGVMSIVWWLLRCTFKVLASRVLAYIALVLLGINVGGYFILQGYVSLFRSQDLKKKVPAHTLRVEPIPALCSTANHWAGLAGCRSDGCRSMRMRPRH